MDTPDTPATASPAPSAAPGRAPSKSKRKKIITLKLPSDKLRQLDSQSPDSKPSNTKAAPSMPPTSPYEPIKTAAPAQQDEPASTSETPKPAEDNGKDKPSAAAAAAAAAAAPANGAKRKGPPGGEGGASKKAKVDENGNPKPRGKPGPKKRKGVEGPDGLPIATTSHKQNPKANTGAINANLRALDLTGKATRKWQKRGLQFASFTGVKWDVPRWNTHKRDKGEGLDSTSQSQDTSSNGRINGVKGDPASSQVQSERSNNGDGSGANGHGSGINGYGSGVNGVSTPNGAMDLASSPAPQMPTPMEQVAAT